MKMKRSILVTAVVLALVGGVTATTSADPTVFCMNSSEGGGMADVVTYAFALLPMQSDQFGGTGKRTESLLGMMPMSTPDAVTVTPVSFSGFADADSATLAFTDYFSTGVMFGLVTMPLSGSSMGAATGKLCSGAGSCIDLTLTMTSCP